MSGHIPKTFISDLLTKADIVDLIGSRISLKKAGANYLGRCPFHQEKSPSFTVSPSKQFYHCFGCGEHGTVLSFLMNYDHLSYVEAIEHLAGTFGLAVPYEHSGSPIKPTVTIDYYDYLKVATTFYQGQLGQNKEAQAYLTHRGLDASIVQRFALGVAPSDWDGLYSQYRSQSCPILEKLGLILPSKQGRYYDRFRSRIMFPIRDYRGRVLGFGGRIYLPNADPNQPKYLNSPETPIFHKGSVLYGLYEAIQANRTLSQVVVVEGYMDVIALAQHGINYAVATMGTAVTLQHLERLFKYTEAVIFCFDGDRAGQQAAKRALEAVLPLMEGGRQVKFMFLPPEEDPDTAVRKWGQTGFEEQLKTARGIGEYLLLEAELGLDLNQLDDRAKLAERVKASWVKLPEGSFKALVQLELVKRTRLPFNDLESSATLKKESQSSISIPTKPIGMLKLTPMRRLIALVLQYPQILGSYVAQTLNELPNTLPGVDVLQAVSDMIKSEALAQTGHLIEGLREGPYFDLAQKLASLSLMVPETGLVAEWQDTVAKIRGEALEREIQDYLARARQQGLSIGEKAHLQALINQRQQEKHNSEHPSSSDSN